MNQEQAELAADVMSAVLKQMNSHINKHGMIKTSSQVIKNWHEYDNTVWLHIFGTVKLLCDKGLLTLPPFVERDIDYLVNHITEYADDAKYKYDCDNLAYPDPKYGLPSRLTEDDRRKYTKTIRTRTFRTMMNVRESLNHAIGVHLPNEDSSKGLLDPTPFEKNFHV